MRRGKKKLATSISMGGGGGELGYGKSMTRGGERTVKKIIQAGKGEDPSSALLTGK